MTGRVCLIAVMFVSVILGSAQGGSSRPVRAQGTWWLSTGKAGGTWRAECLLDGGTLVDCDINLSGFPGRDRFHQAVLTASVANDQSTKDDSKESTIEGSVAFEDRVETTFEGSARGSELSGILQTANGIEGRWEGIWFFPSPSQLTEPYISIEQSAELAQ
jgi:hypothetical protein